MAAGGNPTTSAFAPPRIDLSEFECSVARTLDVVGDKWTLLVIRDAFYGARRFEDFRRDLGIARNVPTDRLGRLVDAGILERQLYQDRPPRCEYRLTRKGRDPPPDAVTLMRLGDTEAPHDQPPVDLFHGDCGNATHAVVSCAHPGEDLTPFNIGMEPLPPTIRDRGTSARTADAGLSDVIMAIPPVDLKIHRIHRHRLMRPSGASCDFADAYGGCLCRVTGKPGPPGRRIRDHDIARPKATTKMNRQLRADLRTWRATRS